MNRRLWTNAGPKSGFWRYRDAGHAVSVMDRPDASTAIGIAFGRSWIPDDRGSIATFRLTLGKAELPGLWVCLGREFVPAEAVYSDVRGHGDVGMDDATPVAVRPRTCEGGHREDVR